MNKKSSSSYPGGSKSRVNRAGAAIRSGGASLEDEVVIEEWRSAHRAVLNSFQAILRNRAEGKKVIVAQRHKRKSTIYDKLQRFQTMELSRMDDVAGCRLIFTSLKQLHEFRRNFHKAKFNHRRRNADDKYNYISNPKSNGYRGIHDVYEYDVKSEAGKSLVGLYIEIQYRTLVQHAWATAVEIIGLFTQNQVKFDKGDGLYREAMALASEILARAHEKSTGPYPDMDGEEIVRRFLEIDQQIGLIGMLRRLNATHQATSTKQNYILMFSGDQALDVRAFEHATDALRTLFILEKENPDKDVVLVRADTTDAVRMAFRNYFSDAQDFINLIENGCDSLTLNGPRKRERRRLE